MSRSSKFPWVQVALFLATLLTTLGWGTLHWFGFYRPNAQPDEIIRAFKSLSFFKLGAPFSLSLMFILLAHEMGHYLVARAYRVDTTLPYFIPAPNILGTFGAVIRIKSPVPSRRALFDIGIAGPLVGFTATIPFLLYGLSHAIVLQSPPKEGIFLGDPLLMKLLYRFYFPGISPQNLVIHPVGLAAWVGLFVTSLNLLPVGQLDGGHIAYATLGREAHKLSIALFLFLLYLGIFKWAGWLVWDLILFFMGIKHPPFEYPDTLSMERLVLSFLALLIFLLTFIPVPIFLKG